MLRLLDVLQPPLAQVADGDSRWEILLGQSLGRPREQDLTSVTGGTDAGCPVDTDTDVALLSHLGLAGVQAHAHLDVRSLGPSVGRQVALGVDSRSHGVGSRAEGDEEGVALGVHDATLMRGEGGVEDLLLSRQKRVVAVLTEPVEKPRRALDVCEQEGDSAGRKLTLGHTGTVPPRNGSVKGPAIRRRRRTPERPVSHRRRACRTSTRTQRTGPPRGGRR